MAGFSEATKRFMIGLRFLPKDDELLSILYINKVLGLPGIEEDRFIFEDDLYGKKEPWEIWDRHWPAFARMFTASWSDEEDRDLYFFTKLKKRKEHNVRVDRRVALGTWQGLTSAREIAFKCGVGLKKRFAYWSSNLDQAGRWRMHEYSIDSTDWVLCRMRKKGAPKSKKREHAVVDAPEEASEDPEALETPEVVSLLRAASC